MGRVRILFRTGSVAVFAPPNLPPVIHPDSQHPDCAGLVGGVVRHGHWGAGPLHL